MIIREATSRDIPWLLGQLREFSRFFGTRLSLMHPDDAVSTAILDHLISTQPFMVAERDADKERLGFMAATLGLHPLNPSRIILSELFWWVAPMHRGSLAAARLFQWFDEFGKRNADWIDVTLEANSPVSASTLEKRGYHLHERNFLKEVERVRAPLEVDI